MIKLWCIKAKLLVTMTLMTACVGCLGESNPPTFPVTGVVTLNGKPVEGATVIFSPTTEGAEAATGKTDATGTYSMTTYVNADGVRPGSYMVKVFKFESLAPPPSESSPNFDPNAELEDEGYDPDQVDTRAAKNLLPPKYSSEVTSGLKLDIKEEPQTFDIDLK